MLKERFYSCSAATRSPGGAVMTLAGFHREPSWIMSLGTAVTKPAAGCSSRDGLMAQS